MPASSLLCPPAETKAGQRARRGGPGGLCSPAAPLCQKTTSWLMQEHPLPTSAWQPAPLAKALSLHPLLALALSSLAKVDAQHEAPGSIWVAQPLAAESKHFTSSHLQVVLMGLKAQAALWR